MESLAYLHLALAYEESVNSEAVSAPESLKLFEGLNWRKLSYSAWIYWLSLAVTLGVLGMTTQALAALEFGDSGSEVTALQQRLQKLGYFTAGVTDYFGPLTKDAVIRFQKDKKLTPNGVVGPETEEALRDLKKQNQQPVSRSTSEILGLGASGQAVQAIQKSLKGLGFYDGPVNGVFDAKTEAAVRAFQKVNNLKIDGLVGPQTMAALPKKSIGQPKPEVPAEPDILRIGDRGSDVAKLQRRLQDLGYFRSQVSGNFDQETKDAVIKFQLDQKIPAYGVAGPMTFSALDKVTNRSSVQALQERLKSKGFYQGPIDGVFNLQTKAAIATAQEHYGVSGDAIMKGRF